MYDDLYLKCPVCGLTYKSLGFLAQHVYELAYHYPRRPYGKGATMRKLHYDWLKERNITLWYESVINYLKSLFAR